MTTLPLRSAGETGTAPAQSRRFELLWRYRERQWIAMALTVVAAAWQLFRSFDGQIWNGTGVIPALADAASAIGPILVVGGIWLWMRADRQRLRIELLLDESATLARNFVASADPDPQRQ